MTQVTDLLKRAELLDTRVLVFRVTVSGDEVAGGHPLVLQKMADLARELDEVTFGGVEVLAVNFDWLILDDDEDQASCTVVNEMVIRATTERDHDALLLFAASQ